MNFFVKTTEKMLVSFLAKHMLHEVIPNGRAALLIQHKRPQDLIKDKITGLFMPDPRSYKMVDEPEVVFNQITNTGRVQLHTQGYATTGMLTNGFNYIGLTNTAITPAAGDTTLSGEIAVNGLTRVQGTVTLATGAGNQTTIDKTFTATGTQSCQAGALFTAISAGVMNHELTFTQRNLINLDTIQTTWTITLG